MNLCCNQVLGQLSLHQLTLIMCWTCVVIKSWASSLFTSSHSLCAGLVLSSSPMPALCSPAHTHYMLDLCCNQVLGQLSLHQLTHIMCWTCVVIKSWASSLFTSSHSLIMCWTCVVIMSCSSYLFTSSHSLCAGLVL